MNLSIGIVILLLCSSDAFLQRKSGSEPVARWGLVGHLQPWEPTVSTASARLFQPPRIDNERRRRVEVSLSTTTQLQAETSSSNDTSGGPVRIIIAGAPASGKGTQCERIRNAYGVVHLSTGDMLRAAVSAGTAIGMEAKRYMDSGRLVPDSTMIGVVKDRLQQDDCQCRGWLLDGFPRTQAQAQALEDAGIKADCFVFLNVPDEVLVERVVGRRTDPVTGKIYHTTFSPPDSAEIAARLEQRSDDTEEKVKVRLEQFHANVEAVKGSYADIMVTIDGNQAPDKVSEEISQAIRSRVGVNV